MAECAECRLPSESLGHHRQMQQAETLSSNPSRFSDTLRHHRSQRCRVCQLWIMK